MRKTHINNTLYYLIFKKKRQISRHIMTYPHFLVHDSLIPGADCGHRSNPIRTCKALCHSVTCTTCRCVLLETYQNDPWCTLQVSVRWSLHGSLALFLDLISCHDLFTMIVYMTRQASTLPIASKHTWLTSPLWRPKAAEWESCATGWWFQLMPNMCVTWSPTSWNFHSGI